MGCPRLCQCNVNLQSLDELCPACSGELEEWLEKKAAETPWTEEELNQWLEEQEEKQWAELELMDAQAEREE